MDLGMLLFSIWCISLILMCFIILIKWEKDELKLKWTHGVICVFCPVLNTGLVLVTLGKIVFRSVLGVYYGFDAFWKSVVYNFWE